METKRNQTEPPTPEVKHPLAKILEYSAHDTTIFSLLNALGFKDLKLPPYASAVLVELHKTNPNPANQQLDLKVDPYFVKVWKFLQNSINSILAFDLPTSSSANDLTYMFFSYFQRFIIVMRRVHRPVNFKFLTVDLRVVLINWNNSRLAYW